MFALLLLVEKMSNQNFYDISMSLMKEKYELEDLNKLYFQKIKKLQGNRILIGRKIGIIKNRT